MARLQSHELRTYLGEPEGRAVAKWLNLNCNEPKGQMLAGFVRYCWYPGKVRPPSEDDFRMFTKEWYGEMDELVQQARSTGFTLRAGKVVFAANPFLKVTTPLWCIQALTSLGVANRLRECRRCRKWFFARFSHQKFCTSKCQQYHYQRSEDGKERRRQYMREYRQSETVKNMRAEQATQRRGR